MEEFIQNLGGVRDLRVSLSCDIATIYEIILL